MAKKEDFQNVFIDVFKDAPVRFCQDNRVYLINDLINVILGGVDLKDAHRLALKEFPAVIELLEYVETMRDNRDALLAQFHATPGPDATPETFARSILNSFKSIEAGEFEEIKDDEELE